MDKEDAAVAPAPDGGIPPHPHPPEHKAAEGEGGGWWVEMAFDAVCGLLDF